MATRSRAGFTLIEAFFTMLIITLFISLTLGYIQKVRQEARDVKRLADLHQLRAALELYAHSHSTYPAGTNILIGHIPATSLAVNGWTNQPQAPIYLADFPADPLPTAQSPCVKNVPQPCAYNYSVEEPADYSVRFYLEHGVPPLAAPGLYQLTARGFRP